MQDGICGKAWHLNRANLVHSFVGNNWSTKRDSPGPLQPALPPETLTSQRSPVMDLLCSSRGKKRKKNPCHCTKFRSLYGSPERQVRNKILEIQYFYFSFKFLPGLFSVFARMIFVFCLSLSDSFRPQEVEVHKVHN